MVKFCDLMIILLCYQQMFFFCVWHSPLLDAKITHRSCYLRWRNYTYFVTMRYRTIITCLSITATPHEHHGASNHRWIKCLYNSLLRLISKKTLKPPLLVFYEGIHHWPVDSPRRGPVTLKAFPCHDFFMNPKIMMTSSNGNIFCVTGPLCGEFTGPRWIPRTKASDAMFSLISINGWVNNHEAGDLRPYRAHYDVTVMCKITTSSLIILKLQNYMDVFSILTAWII